MARTIGSELHSSVLGSVFFAARSGGTPIAFMDDGGPGKNKLRTCEYRAMTARTAQIMRTVYEICAPTLCRSQTIHQDHSQWNLSILKSKETISQQQYE
ncbi:hypothetical protein MesoLj131a_61710 [Mesorhizobium sp. 131-2-1]|nr:hypothetical protein MesoLj131a_61710 [Mesorhizobium sp. 131-2-1]BCH04378.1 hypothetical protein MesoLj131b_63770 [Mesorhizobium sp. 131-2-5]